MYRTLKLTPYNLHGYKLSKKTLAHIHTLAVIFAISEGESLTVS